MTRRQAHRYVERGEAAWTDAKQREIEIITVRPQASPSVSHSPNLQIHQLRIGHYRNFVLGLPNFVGFVGEQGTPGKRVK